MPTDYLARALSRIEVIPNGCWRWTRGTDGRGYGRFSVGRKTWSAARFMYTELTGPIPADLELDHICHTYDTVCLGGVTCAHRLCVNPDHLEAVPQAVNSSRRVTAAARKRAAETHCVHGHEINAENTYVRPEAGYLLCRVCDREAQRRRREQAVRGPHDLGSCAGRTYLERGCPVFIERGWRGEGPRNVLIRRQDGSRVVRPFRGLRRPPTTTDST